MNKAFLSAATCIMIIALAGLAYTASNPLIDTCAPPTVNGLRSMSAVCTRQETTNWTGISISLAGLLFGIILTAYSLRAQKK